MAYYSRSHYSLPTEAPFPALYGGYILASDGSGATDATVKAVAKAVIEAPAGIWGASVYGGGAYGVSALRATDAAALAMAKALTDGVIATDAALKALAIAITDGVATADATVKHIGKVEWEEPAGVYGLGVYGFSEYAGAGALQASEAASKAMAKAITDGVTAADLLAKHFYAVFTEGVTAADAVGKAIDKLIADGVEVDDTNLDILILMILSLMQRNTTLHVQERP